MHADLDPELRLVEELDGLYLEMTVAPSWARPVSGEVVTTERLGRAKVPDLPYVQPDRALYYLDTDYLGRRRDVQHPFPGPFEVTEGGRLRVKVWPSERATTP